MYLAPNTPEEARRIFDEIPSDFTGVRLQHALMMRDLPLVEEIMQGGFDPNAPVLVHIPLFASQPNADGAHGASVRFSLDNYEMDWILVMVLDFTTWDSPSSTVFLDALLEIVPFDRDSYTRGLLRTVNRNWRPFKCAFYESICRRMIVHDASLPLIHRHDEGMIPLGVTERLRGLVYDRNRVRRAVRVLYGIARFRFVPEMPHRDLWLLIANTLLPLPR
jgi:hypothetical protein